MIFISIYVCYNLKLSNNAKIMMLILRYYDSDLKDLDLNSKINKVNRDGISNSSIASLGLQEKLQLKSELLRVFVFYQSGQNTLKCFLKTIKRIEVFINILRFKIVYITTNA